MKVLSLHVYPVKACRRIDLEEAPFGPLGLDGDRRFAFIDADGNAITQRDQPLLATVRPALSRDALHLDLGGLATLQVPLSAFTASTSADVWGNRVPARAAAAGAIAQAMEYLGTPARLVMLDASAQRGFVDSRPVLVTTSGMLAELNRRLASAVGMERFRPNLVLEGGAASWLRLEGDETLLEFSKPCGRCEVTTIDQASGARMSDEPLRTLHEAFGGTFGLYCTVARGGRLRVGETLRAA